MNILFISTNSPEISVGGIERYIFNLLNYCPSRTNHNFIFLLPKSQKPEEETKQNITIYRKNFLLFKPKRIFGKKILTQKQIDKNSDQLFDFLDRLGQKTHIDFCIVQAGDGLPPRTCLSLHLACLNHKIPLILRVHSYPTKKVPRLLINCLPWAKILTVSKSLAGDLFAKKTDISKLKNNYLGVDKKIFNARLSKKWLKRQLKLSDDKKIIFHASRITDGKKSILKEKGIITLLEAFSKLYVHYPDLYLLFATATPPKHFKDEFQTSLQKLRDYAQLYNVADRVLVKSFSLDKIAKAYAGADVFVLASENETFGQVYLEAMACGTPVIGTNVGGVSEIIKNDDNGFLIPPNNSSILNQKIEELLLNQDLRKKFIKNGLKTINRRFSAKKQLGSLISYLETKAGGAS